MLATENSVRKLLQFLPVAMMIAASGCAPSGPRALLVGDALLREGKPALAIEKLTQATRAMPDEPRAWNLLALAYHRASQPQLALQAYRQALAKDRSNRVAIAHYNLGCLLLEQNNPAAAADEFRSFTLVTNSAAGFAKLATAQLRLRQFDSAERNFNAALRLDLKNVEALNGIGVIHAHKNQRDAAQFFNSALQWNPKYAPALLNSALVAQQNPAARPLALQRFRDYLSVAPRSPHADFAKSFVRQSEADSPPRAIATSNSSANALLKTNALLAVLQTSNNAPATNAPPRNAVAPTNAKTQVVPAKTNTPVVAPQVAAPKTNLLAVGTNIPAAPPNVPVTVVTLSNSPRPRVAVPADIPQAREPIVPPPAETVATDSVEARSPTTDDTKKPGFFARLNPFRGRNAAETNDSPRAIVLNPQSVPGGSSVTKQEFPRYAYHSPAPPKSGNRPNAERAMAQAARAQRAGNDNEAMLDYQLAIAADPGFFDAHYNLGLFALATGDLNRALDACEMALAIQPDSINARYSFALALKQANYALDAVVELERILEAKPNEVRAHLALGNLYAQQLNDARKARVHYLRVLELEPRHSQAAAIRFWLAANP